MGPFPPVTSGSELVEASVRRRRFPVTAMMAIAASVWVGPLASVGAERGGTDSDSRGAHRIAPVPDVRAPLGLHGEQATEHRGVMLQHLEAVQAIMAALAEEDYDRGQGIAEADLGFAKHRDAMARQEPEAFPPVYHDLAMAHHEAAEDLARAMPSKDLKQILPRFNRMLKACVACHLEFKVRSAEP